jgi:glycerol-3-phosphate cytidylyltransferase
MKKYKIGYTQGTFDMFHIGHLNLLRQAKKMCEKLIVGINSDALVQQYKNKTPVVNENDRMEIVRELRCVDEVIKCDTLKKTVVCRELHFDAIFIGSDWKGNARWAQTEKDLVPFGADVVYLKHTDGISSTLLSEKKSDRIEM